MCSRIHSVIKIVCAALILIIVIIINDHHVIANVNKTVKKCYHSIKARSFLQDKYNWDDYTIENIWWNIHFKALRSLQLHDRIRTHKYIHNHCSTNHRDHLHYGYKPETCNSCHTVDETEDHILQGHTDPRRKLRKAWCREILNYDKKWIPIDIRKAMCLGIQSWLEMSTVNLEETLLTFPANIQKAFRHQTKIGWNHFARGRLSLSWGAIINDHFTTTQFDAETWGSKVIDIVISNIYYYFGKTDA